MAFEFDHTEANGKGAFTAREDGVPAGEVTYSRVNASTIIVDHTQVLPGFEGRGLGRQLVSHAVSRARETGQQIMPLCPFARGLFERTPDYADVWFR